MKKFLSKALAAMLCVTLVGCGNASDGQESQTITPTTAPSQDAATEPETTEPTGALQQEETTEPDVTEVPDAADEPEVTEGEVDSEETTMLVAYFSWSGNTQELAELVQEETQADLFVIEPATAYTDDYDDLLDVAQEELRTDARPALASTVENWEDYDVIFVGYPNWWSDAPRVILSFLEAHDCTGKTIVPFCTSGGGGFGRSRASVENSAAGATILEGLHVSGSRVGSAADTVADWIQDLELEK